MAQRVRAVASHDGLTPLSQVPGMETAALKDTAKAFYASVFNATFSSLSRLINHVQREEIRRAAAEQLVAAYEVRCPSTLPYSTATTPIVSLPLFKDDLCGLV